MKCGLRDEIHVIFQIFIRWIIPPVLDKGLEASNPGEGLTFTTGEVG